MKRTVMMVLIAVMACVMGLSTLSAAGQRDKNKPLTIQMIVMSINSEYWLNVKAGSEAELSKVGGRLIYTGPSIDGDIQGQINMVENAISSKVDGIILIPLDSDALVPVVQRAIGAEIPTVIVDGPVNWDGVTSYIATDNVAASKLAMETLFQLINNRGKVAIINALAGIPSNDGRNIGASEAVKNSPNVQLLEILRGPDQAAALQNAENLLTANRDLAGIFSAYDRGAIGAGQALNNAGLSGKVRHVAFDASPDQIKMLEDGTIDALVVQQPYEMGRMAVEYIIKALNQESVPKVVATDVVVVTRQNMNKPEIQKVLYPTGK
jgi:ribose transport system substrate-binding protein